MTCRSHFKLAGSAIAPRKNEPVSIKEPVVEISTSIYLSADQLAKRFAISKNSVWRWVKTRADFPRPIALGPACTRFKLSDIEAFEAKMEGDR